MQSRNLTNIVLVGFMGTGKTTVGRMLADRLGWSFIDTDRLIETEAAMSIPEMFRSEGEPAFRERERETLARVLAKSHQVVSTGGGAVLREDNRRLMLAGGLVVALTADVRTIVARVGNDPGRPLLEGNAERRVAELLAARAGAYDFAHVAVDTGENSLSATIDTILRSLKEAGNRPDA